MIVNLHIIFDVNKFLFIKYYNIYYKYKTFLLGNLEILNYFD